MQFPHLNNNFSYQGDAFSNDDFISGYIPRLYSFATDPGDILDDVLEDEFELDGIPTSRGDGESDYPQYGLFAKTFMSGDFSSFWNMLEECFTAALDRLSTVLPSRGGNLNFDELNLGDGFAPFENRGVSKGASYPGSRISALYAYSSEPPPLSSTPGSSTPGASVPDTSLPVSSVPILYSHSGSSPFDTRPQVGPLTPEEGRTMAVKVARQLMIDFPGMSEEQAAGIVGNLWHESAGMNPNVNEFGSSPPDKTYGPPNETQFGYGWAQWTGTRKWDYINFCQREGLDPRSPAANYAFLKHELKNGEADGTPSSLPHIFAANTVDEAAYAFRQKYERATMPVDSERLKHARELYGLL